MAKRIWVTAVLVTLVVVGAVVIPIGVRAALKDDQGKLSHQTSADIRQDGFVTACGKMLCLGGPWRLYGASVYRGLAAPETIVQQARAVGLNTVRLTDYLDAGSVPVEQAAYDESHWRRVDALLALAQNQGLKVVLDLSEYRNLLERHGVNPYTADWDEMLRFVMNRTNTINGQVYRGDPTIAYVAVAGEIDLQAANNVRLGVSSEQVTRFFERTLAQLAHLDPGHLHTAGGMSHLETTGGIDWRRIMALPGNQLCAIHNYSDYDSQTVTPAVAATCAKLGKPWLLEEFGFRQSLGDEERAEAFARMLRLQDDYKAAGVAFWNLGSEIATGSYDVNPQTPKTYAVVRQSAP